MAFTHIDLFTGIAGFSLAASWVWPDYTPVAFCERDPFCQRVIAKHWPGVPIIYDIHDFNGRNYAPANLLTGGFPCQPWSVAGEQRGAEDDRALWPEMYRIVRENGPDWVVAENVAGIVKMELDRVLSDLEGAGYTCWTFVLPASSVNAPHERYRTWIVAHANRQREQQSAGISDSGRGWIGDSGKAGGVWETSRRLAGRRVPDSGIRLLAPRIPGGMDGSAIAAYGNAIPPAVVAEIFRAIREVEYAMD